jgi:hypothetical protein
MASNLRHRPMPSLPFCPSVNDPETDDDESHEPSSQSEYSPSESRGDASVGSVYEDEDEDQAGTETDRARTEEATEEAEGPRQGLYSMLDASDEDVERAKQLVMHVNHPFLLVKAAVSKNCRIKKSKHKLSLDEDAVRIAIKAFLDQLTSLPSCFNRHKCHFIKCGCIRKIKDDHAHADEYLLAVALMTKKEQDALYKELINGRHNRSRGYNLRIGNDKTNGYSMDICMNSFLNLVAIGRKRFTNLSMTRFLPGKNKHKNNGNNYCALTQDVVDSVSTFIQDKGATEGEVYATRVIRSLTKTELRDEEIGAVDLPSNTTKREMYELYCFNRGWTVKSDNKGRYPKVVDYKRRKVDDMFWQEDMESFEVCSWWSFRNIWKEHCSNIRIRSPCNDTCGECTIFRNAFRYRSSKVGKVHDDVSDGESDSEVEAASDDEDALVDKDDIKTFVSDDVGCVDSCLEQERILEAAGFHIAQAKGMRGYVQAATERAKQCRDNEVPHKDRDYVLVCDYAQNMPLPHYGGEQPGEIYYFSALTINLFGIVDLSRTPNKLNCYAYREFTGKKGSNNVASLLMQDLHDKFWLRKGSPGKSLTIAMDNCGGQNKNNVVLRLAPYLVEMGYFLKVEFAFYIRGHTKNACDRTYNQMKSKYHKKDIFTWEQALQTLNIKEHVNVVDTKEDVFKDYGAMLDTFYGTFKPGTIQKNHIFRVEDTDASLLMQCSTHSEAPFVEQAMLKRGQARGDTTRIAAMEAFELQTLKAPGLRPIKQVELYKKFRPFVPREFWEDTCPRPSDEVLAQVKDESSKKRKTKVPAAKSATKKRVRRAPKVKNAIGLAVPVNVAASDESTETELSEEELISPVSLF